MNTPTRQAQTGLTGPNRLKVAFACHFAVARHDSDAWLAQTALRSHTRESPPLTPFYLHLIPPPIPHSVLVLQGIALNRFAIIVVITALLTRHPCPSERGHKTEGARTIWLTSTKGKGCLNYDDRWRRPVPIGQHPWGGRGCK